MLIFTCFFKKKKEKQKVEIKPLKSELVIFEQLYDAEDETLIDLANKLKRGAPIVLSFSRLNIDDANKAIAFFSGVVYALNGQSIQFGGNEGRNILFCDGDLYKDGSMQQVIDDIMGRFE